MKKVIMMAGSLRKESANKKLINIAAQSLAKDSYKICFLNDYNCSLYNADDEESKGIPTEINLFVKEMQHSTHMIFALPEYNSMMPGVFKNFFDWVSRVRPMPWANKKILLISASPSGFGGMRGFIHNRAPFESCGAVVYPKSFFLSDAYNGFNQNGDLKSEDQNKILSNLIKEFLAF
ncbi:MAG: NAD(P)H-dependent oxidoreductase [Rickettsiales bacterium]|nr:NAD(P)H-dependent oxidoreductase [Rickettsiales bacterium]